MKIVDEFDYVFHKSVAENIISDLDPLLKKISENANKLTEKIFVIEEKIQKENNTVKINKYSESVDALKEKALELIRVKDRISLIIERNKSRVAFLTDKLKKAGIYVNKIDKKKLAEVKKEYKDQISTENLNLNQNHNENNVVLKNVNGELLTLVNGKLDLSLDENVDILTNASQEFVLSVIRAYPESVNTIPPKHLLNCVFKKKILKAVASFAMNEKETSVQKINNSFGNLLSFKTEIPKDAEGFVAGVQNMFNVIAKQELMQNNPDKAQEINKKLRCNQKSELIPASKKIEIFAQGLAGEDEYLEEVESEEVRINKEKEIELDLFAQFELDMQAIAKELEEETQMLEKEAREREEQMKVQKEHVEEEMQEKMMSKNDIIDD